MAALPAVINCPRNSGGCFGRIPGRRLSRPPVVPFFLAAVLLILLLLVTHALWLSALARYLVDADAPAPADVVVVLAGDLTGKRLLTGSSP